MIFLLEKDNDILDKTILNEEWFWMDSSLIARHKEYSCKTNGNRRKLLQSARDIHVEKLWDYGILKQNKCSMLGGICVNQIFCNMEWEIASENGQVVCA